jgi:hypothetical protein
MSEAAFTLAGAGAGLGTCVQARPTITIEKNRTRIDAVTFGVFAFMRGFLPSQLPTCMVHSYAYGNGIVKRGLVPMLYA